MVRQLHLRTQGGPESSAAHPDVIGDRCVCVGERKETQSGNVQRFVNYCVKSITLDFTLLDVLDHA